MIHSVAGRLLASRAGVALAVALVGVFLAGIVAVAALSGQAPAKEPATELLIRVRPPSGETQPVRLTQAQLLVAWWGHTEEVPLSHRYEGGELLVTVPLNRDIGSRGALQAPDFAYVHLEFDGFARARSERFHWLGGSAPSAAAANWEAVTVVQFRFRGGPTVDIGPGERREVSLQVRRPVSKQLRLVDDHGRAFTGITVDGGVFWSRANHCGYPSGLQPLFVNRRPDADGVLPVPDGDVEYGFRVGGDEHVSIIGAASHDPTFLATFIDTPELLVRIRRHRRVPLDVRVFIGGAPAAGVIVGGTRRAGCMNTTGPLGTTDEHGVLLVPEFYPEEYEGVCIAGLDGRPVWSAEPGRGDFTIDLPAGTKVGEFAHCSAADVNGK